MYTMRKAVHRLPAPDRLGQEGATPYALQSGLKLLATLLPQLLKCWDLQVRATTSALKSGSNMNCQGQEDQCLSTVFKCAGTSPAQGEE